MTAGYRRPCAQPIIITMVEPIYTAANCRPAYQLRWSLALFSVVDLPSTEIWWGPLSEAVEADGVRMLDYHAPSPRTWLFLLSTQPHVAPQQIVRSVKGRLQYCIRMHQPRAFQRNFSLTSVGDARRETVETYVATQLNHHRMADDRMQQRLDAFQFTFPEVDLAQPVRSSHGQYLYNLHLVLVHNERLPAVCVEQLSTSHDMFVRAARKNQHRLSKLSLNSDHLHATMGCAFNQAPQEVALGYMNNLSYAHGMTHWFSNGYYVGTFGEYDMGALRHES